MSQIAETRHYAARAKRLLDENDRKAVRSILSIDPLHGAIIPGSGGVRKMRYALAGRGKSGGVRISIIIKRWMIWCFCWIYTLKNRRKT